MGWYSDSHLLLIYRELTVDSGIGESLFCYVVGGGGLFAFLWGIQGSNNTLSYPLYLDN